MRKPLQEFCGRSAKTLRSLASNLEKLAHDPYSRRPLSAAAKAAQALREESAQAGLQGLSSVADAMRHALDCCNRGLCEIAPGHLQALDEGLQWLQQCMEAVQGSQPEIAVPTQDWLIQLQEPDGLPSGETPASSPSGLDMDLHDLAAMLVQVGPDDLSGLSRIQEGLGKLSASQPDSSQAGPMLESAAQKLEQAVEADSAKDRENLISEAGLYVDAASDAMEAAPGSSPVAVQAEAYKPKPKAPASRHPTERGSDLPSVSAPSLDEILQLLNNPACGEAVDLESLQESLQRLSQEPSLPSEARELLCQAAERCNGVEEEPRGRESHIAEIGLFLDAASDMLDSRSAPTPVGPGPPSEQAMPQGEEAENAADGFEPLFVQLPEDADLELMAEFITESSEAIDAAEASLLDLETSPQDVEAINTVFRSFHTIKGTSAFLGLDVISHLAHLAENLLSRIREQEIACAGGYADLALRSIDILKELLQAVQDALGGQSTPVGNAYHDLISLLENPEAHGISEEAGDDERPQARLGDILVNQGKAERDDVEAVASSKGKGPLGRALVKSGTAKVSDVAHALRSQKRSAGPDSSVRVKTEKLDRMIDMVGELVIAHSMVAQDELVLDRSNFETTRKVTQAGKIVRELQDLCMSLRMVPMRAVFQKMARLVRDLSRKIGKQVEFSSEGEETEIDRNMVDIIGDPLVHMVRNAVDHGIEMPQERLAAGKPAAGQVSLRAYHEGGNVIVELKDDGKGLDREKIAAKAMAHGLIDSAEGLSDREVFDLIFAAGFSTARQITDVSGRGVGMDVVRRSIDSLRGRVQIASKLGQGSTFTLVLPLTLAITDGMLIRVGQERFIIPTVNIEKNFRPQPDSLSTVTGRGETVLLRGELMPIYRLHRLFEIEGAVQDPTQGILVVMGDGRKRYAVLVDELLGQQQVVAKPLGGGLGQVEGVSGAAILGDGRAGLILDTSGLAKLAQQSMSNAISSDLISVSSNGEAAECR